MNKLLFILLSLIIMSGCLSKTDSSKKEAPSIFSEISDREEIEFNPAMQAAMVDLTKEKFVEALNRTRDTFFRNSKNKKITYISFGDYGGYAFSNTDLHKYLLSHLPKEYSGDTTINLKTTRLTVGMIYYIDYEIPWWRLEYYLRYNNEIIMSDGDDFHNSVNNNYGLLMISQLPDMSKYGYK